MGFLIALGVLAAIALVVILWLIATYNKLVRLRNDYQNAFSQIDVQLRRRYDLIPNLVETAKKYMAHERDTLEAVIEARNQAQKIEVSIGDGPIDPGTLGQLARAEGALGGALSRLLAVSEAYPDLKADQNMRQLTEELTSTENKVAFARQAYNDFATGYNTYREQFPPVVVASAFNFEKAALWEIDESSSAAREPVKVSFD